MGAIKLKHVQKLLKTSYEDPKKGKAPTGYKRDASLSGKRVQVYTNDDNKAFVVHRGTAGMMDVLTDVKFALNRAWFKKSKRYQQSQKIQKLAYDKYGKENTTTMGHSLGGALAESVGRKSKQVITLNKAANLSNLTKRRRDNQVDIYSKDDAVSLLARNQKGGRAIAIEPDKKDPILPFGGIKGKPQMGLNLHTYNEHHVDILNRVGGTVDNPVDKSAQINIKDIVKKTPAQMLMNAGEKIIHGITSF